MTKLLKTDLCIIGAGSGGLSVAAGAAQLGRDVVLIERHKMGGDCLNFGCVPSKALLAAGAVAQTIRTASKFGIKAADPLIDYGAVHDHVHGVIAAIEPNDSQDRFEALGCTVLREDARFTGRREVTAGDTVVRAKHFVIATGSAPFVPPIEGLKTVPYLTNETLFDLKECPDHLIVVGGGPIGIEMAQAHRRLGAKVTVLERGGDILPKDDPELVAILAEELRGEGLTLETQTEVHEVAKGAEGHIIVKGAKAGAPYEVTGSHLLIAVGRQPPLASLDLQTAGVATHPKGITVDQFMRTSNPRIYAIGDCTGGRQFTHVAGYHASLVVQNILFKTPRLTFGIKGGKNHEEEAPWVTYTDPELAHVGLTAQMAEARGESYSTALWDYEENDRAQAERATRGKIKVVIGKGGRLLGASIVGKKAGDLIGPWQLAVANGLKIGAFTKAIMPYPTLSEVSKRAAGAYYTPSLFSDRTRMLVRLLASFD
ncbi:Putative mercuric reductase protein [Parvularcula bermudensis HTCC2503]|uniref:Putative mercuric reductase protein n=1 Tax=Parvularcula bermudensis (strain ATCC BAA-594 / HTCC2503 / KCTC 12087) TaxID=314260 RepID=E0TGR1_PARBH|nr:FAD-dependent oxidoreductase [Parvularcula bermudensis]ADM10670.1 Putative mercuric reductase protein [Parvularcula bermudensis HTCC2503]